MTSHHAPDYETDPLLDAGNGMRGVVNRERMHRLFADFNQAIWIWVGHRA